MLLLQLGEKPFRRTDDGDVLARRGIKRTLVETLHDAEAYLPAAPYDIVFVDLDLADYPGDALVRGVRHVRPQIPIFAFTSNHDLRFKIKILDLGADDVMTSLCPIDELLARVRAVLRRLENHMSSTLTFGPLQVMMERRQVTVHGQKLHLSPTEYQLIELLVRRHGMAVPRETCLGYLYSGKDEPDLKVIDVLVWRLRKKLAAHGCGGMIRNVWGHGFKLEIDPPSESTRPGHRRRRGEVEHAAPPPRAIGAEE